MSGIHAPIALTPGEPAGIGPDLVIQLAAAGQLPPEVVVIADPELLAARAKGLNLPFTPRDWQTRLDTPPYDPAATWVAPVPLRATAQPGCLNPDNADYVLETLTRATRGCLSGEFGALVTGPVHKGVINDSGVPFSGHTEFLAELCGGMTPVMMLATERLRVALVTTHLPLRAVPDAITPPALETVIRILHRDLQQRFRIPAPRILVCGLNPHAGEGGHLGREEIDVIVPILDVLRGEGMDLRGPLPADTAFTPASLAHGDVVLAMYHDQGLPVLKHDGFGAAVNVTLGLPIVRTSVDHGTALDLAATGRAGTGSLLTALRLAQQLAV